MIAQSRSRTRQSLVRRRKRGHAETCAPRATFQQGDAGPGAPKSGDFGYGWVGLFFFCLVLTCTGAVAQDNGDAIETPRWQFVEGQTYRWRLMQRVDASQQLEAGAETSYLLKMTLDARWDVQQVDEQGAATVLQTIERIQLSVDGPGEQTMQYDSRAEESPRGFAARMAPLAKVLIDEPVSAVVLPTGAVREVSLPEALRQQLLVAPGAKNLANLTSAEALEQWVQQISLVLPDAATLSTGDSWEQTVQVDAPAIGPLTAQKSFRLVEQREADGQQWVVFEPTIELVAPEKAEDEDLHVTFKDQQTTGEVVFNRTAGRLQSSRVTHALVAEFRIGERTSTQTIKQTIETTWQTPEADAP